MAHHQQENGLGAAQPTGGGVVQAAYAQSGSPYTSALASGLAPLGQSTDRDDGSLYKNANPNRITTSAPGESFRLNYFDVMCLVCNRMIGTGIFLSPQRVMNGTRSTGASLMLWSVGVLYCVAGSRVYAEYGLSAPRYWINGVEQAVPRSGGDLNYLSYVYRRPAYRRDTVLFVPTVFAISFVVLGNVAGNSIQFGTRVLLASGYSDPPPNGSVRAIAVTSALFACFIHSFSRRGGILLNNVLAVVKVCLLLLIIATAIAVAAGAFGTENVSAENMSARKSFETVDAGAGDSNGYVRAFLAIIFTFSGFEQPNYVLGEIGRPRRTFPIGAGMGVAIVVTLYMLVNIAYMVVVPKADQVSSNVALRFFELTYGRISSNQTAVRLFNSFIAVSSIGNIIVMTYTAARVKQEIAKEGILPFAKFFAQNSDLSLGRVLRRLRNRGRFVRILRHPWLLPEHHTERTPVGALCMHFLLCFVLIFATWRLSPDDAYGLLVSLTAYVVNCFFGALLGIGLLVLRFRGPPPTPVDPSSSDTEGIEPEAMSKLGTHDPHTTSSAGPQAETPRPSWHTYAGSGFPAWLSVTTAAFYVLATLYPIVATWIPPSARSVSVTPLAHQWFVLPVVAWCVIALGVVWWFGFLWYARREEKRGHHVFVIERTPDFEPAGPVQHADGLRKRKSDQGGNEVQGGRDGYVMTHETVYLSWVGKETLTGEGDVSERTPRHGEVAAPGGNGGLDRRRQLAGTDFDGYYGA